MSSDSSDSKNPLAAFLGNAFLVAIPLVLIVMLGIVGSAFVGGMKKKPVKAEAVAAAPSPALAASAPAAGAAPAAPAAGGAPTPAPAAAIDPAVMALGKQSYMLCAACDHDQSLLVVLKGIAKENMNFMGVMAPLAAGLDDQKLAAVLTYTRNEWGNSAPAVTVEQAAAARAKFAGVNAPAGVKRAEIEAIVAAHKK